MNTALAQGRGRKLFDIYTQKHGKNGWAGMDVFPGYSRVYGGSNVYGIYSPKILMYVYKTGPGEAGNA
jgi:hypothetical protein